MLRKLKNKNWFQKKYNKKDSELKSTMAAEFNLEDYTNEVLREVYHVINHEHEDIYLTEEMFNAYDVFSVVHTELDYYVTCMSRQGKRHLIIGYGIEEALQLMIVHDGPMNVAPTEEALCYNILVQNIPSPSYIGFKESMEYTGVETYANENIIG